MRAFTTSAVLCVASLLLAAPAQAESFNDRCPDIASCAKVVSELLGQKYVYDADVKGKIEATANLDLTRENAVWLFTDMLYTNGFTRLPLGHDTYQLVRIRDAKDSIIPLVEASKQVIPALGDNWDWTTMRYKAANPEVVAHISRELRNFMPPNSRIMPSELDGTILVTDSAPNLKKLYEMIRNLDQKPSTQLKKQWEEEERARRAEKKSAS